MIYDTIAVEDEPAPEVLLAMKVSEEGETSNVAEEEANDSNGSFSASETGGDVTATGGLDSAGEEEEEPEGEPMDVS